MDTEEKFSRMTIVLQLDLVVANFSMLEDKDLLPLATVITETFYSSDFRLDTYTVGGHPFQPKR
jgi:hypothetical protein